MPSERLPWQVIAALAAALTFALLQAAIPNTPNDPRDLAIAFGNGIAIAFYAPLLRSAGPDRLRRTSITLFIILGLTHVFWALYISQSLASAAGALGLAHLTRSLLPVLFLTTGAVFGALILIDQPRLISAAILLASTALATALAADQWWRSANPLNAPNVIGLPAAPLHFGIAVTLFLAARLEHARPRPGFCPACEYDLRGLSPDAACPECGALSRARGGTP